MRAPRDIQPAQNPQVVDQSPESKSMTDMGQYLKTTIVPLGTFFAAVGDILPPLAAFFSICWMAWQWYHSPPMKEWRKKKGRK